VTARPGVIPPGFDPVLRDLVMVLDPDAVAELFGSDGAVVTDLRLHDVKWDPGSSAVVTYALRRELSSGESAPAFASVAARPDGVTRWWFDADPALPAVGRVLRSPELAAQAVGGGTDRPSPMWTVVPVRYRPGERCVVRYSANGEGPTCYGKVFARSPVDGAARISALRDELTASGGDLQVAPVTVVDDLNLLVFAAAPGSVDLNRAAFDPAWDAHDRADALRAAGRAVGVLHGCQLADAPVRGLGDDIAELRTLLPAVEHAARWGDQAAARQYRDVLALLEVAASGLPGATGGSSTAVGHGALRLDQLVTSAQGCELIDLDSLCRATPARDLANLFGYLDWKALRRPELVGAVEAAEATLRAGYAERATMPADDVVGAFRAATALKIAGRRFRNLAAAEWPVIPGLLAHAHTLLEPWATAPRSQGRRRRLRRAAG
jgi:hypothetical protein